MHLLLFDIDGTLMDARGAGRRAMERVGKALFGGGFTFEGIAFGGRLDPLLFAEAAARHGLGGGGGLEAAHERFRRAYLVALAEELAGSDGGAMVLPGVHTLLAALRRRVAGRNGRGVTLGCLTGNYTAAVPIKLRHAGIDPGQFTVTAFGDEAPSRPDLVALALRRFEAHHGRAADPSEVVVIGDTEHDVGCAKHHGCVALGVLTGRVPAERLLGAGADGVVEDLTDASALWSLLGD